MTTQAQLDAAELRHEVHMLAVLGICEQQARCDAMQLRRVRDYINEGNTQAALTLLGGMITIKEKA